MIIAYFTETQTRAEDIKNNNNNNNNSNNNNTSRSQNVGDNHVTEEWSKTPVNAVNPPDIVIVHQDGSSESIFEKIFQCFSMRENLKIIFNTKKSANAIPVIDGLK